MILTRSDKTLVISREKVTLSRLDIDAMASSNTLRSFAAENEGAFVLLSVCWTVAQSAKSGWKRVSWLEDISLHRTVSVLYSRILSCMSSNIGSVLIETVLGGLLSWSHCTTRLSSSLVGVT